MRRILLIFTMMLVLVFIGYVFGFLTIRGKNYELGNKISSYIRSEVSLGSNRYQVEKWLASKKISRYSYIEGTENLKAESDVRRGKYKPEQLGGLIQALIPDVKSSLFHHWSIHITFFFSKEGRLIDYQVQQGAIGL